MPEAEAITAGASVGLATCALEREDLENAQRLVSEALAIVMRENLIDVAQHRLRGFSNGGNDCRALAQRARHRSLHAALTGPNHDDGAHLLLRTYTMLARGELSADLLVTAMLQSLWHGAETLS